MDLYGHDFEQTDLLMMRAMGFDESGYRRKRVDGLLLRCWIEACAGKPQIFYRSEITNDWISLYLPSSIFGVSRRSTSCSFWSLDVPGMAPVISLIAKPMVGAQQILHLFGF